MISALFDLFNESSRLKPTTEVTLATPGVLRAISSTRFTTASVRLTEAPSGNWTSANTAPWSSDGRKPVGVTLNSQPAPAITATSSSKLSTASRTVLRTTSV